MSKLSYEEVKARITGAHADVLNDLSQLGETLVRDAVDRIAKLDSKATATAAYSGGVVTLTMSTVSLWGHNVSGIFKLSAALGIAGLLLAAWLAIRSTFPLDTQWHSDDDWLQRECLGDAEQMRRFRVLTMWKIVDSLDLAQEQKQQRLHRATITIQGAFILLLISFLQIACRVTALQSLGVGVWEGWPATLITGLVRLLHRLFFFGHM